MDSHNNIKRGIILAIARRGTVKRARDIQFEVQRDEHNINHVLYSLSRQGLVAFRLYKKGSIQEPQRIRLTKTGQALAEEIQP